MPLIWYGFGTAPAAETVRKRGYATDLQELENGVCCVAAPIRGRSGDVVGAISASAVELRMTPERIAFLGPELSKSQPISPIGWAGALPIRAIAAIPNSTTFSAT